MCIAFLVYRIVPDLPLVLAANRDEFYHRPTAPMDFWEDRPYLLAGKDLLAGGTWLGVNRHGRLAFLTNFRDLQERDPDPPSRGLLVTRSLDPEHALPAFTATLERERHRYRGFNLIYGSLSRLYYASNRDGAIRRLTPGIYGLSNHLLDSPWPKVTRGKALLAAIPRQAEAWTPERLFQILGDHTTPDDAHLPNTGVGSEWERILAPIFITGDGYGTRSGTVLTFSGMGRVKVEERTFQGGFQAYSSKVFSFDYQPD